MKILFPANLVEFLWSVCNLNPALCLMSVEQIGKVEKLLLQIVSPCWFKSSFLCNTIPKHREVETVNTCNDSVVSDTFLILSPGILFYSCNLQLISISCHILSVLCLPDRSAYLIVCYWRRAINHQHKHVSCLTWTHRFSPLHAPVSIQGSSFSPLSACLVLVLLCVNVIEMPLLFVK